MVSNIFFFHPYLGKWSNLTNIFQRGWNHQLEWLRKHTIELTCLNPTALNGSLLGLSDQNLWFTSSHWDVPVVKFGNPFNFKNGWHYMGVKPYEQPLILTSNRGILAMTNLFFQNLRCPYHVVPFFKSSYVHKKSCFDLAIYNHHPKIHKRRSRFNTIFGGDLGAASPGAPGRPVPRHFRCVRK